jgi:hypothetical protein
LLLDNNTASDAESRCLILQCANLRDFLRRRLFRERIPVNLRSSATGCRIGGTMKNEHIRRGTEGCNAHRAGNFLNERTQRARIRA